MQEKTLSHNQGFDNLVQLQVAREEALQAARAAVRDTTRLTRLLAIISEPGTTDLLLDRALATLSELFTADIIVLFDPIGTGSFSPLASIGLPEYMAEEPFSYESGTYLREVLHEEKPLQIQNVSDDMKIDLHFREMDVNVLVVLPVKGENSIRGALVVARCRPDLFAASEIDLLTTMAYRIGLALEDAQRKLQLEQIIQSGNIIGRILDANVITSESVRLFVSIAHADCGAIVLRQTQGGFYCSAMQGLPEDYGHELARLAVYIMDDPELLADRPYCLDTFSPLFPSLGLRHLQESHIQSLLAIPIHQKEVIVGILFTFRFNFLKFNSISVQMGMLYSNYVSAALENALLYQAGQNELAERIKAEQALRASDDRFRALIRSVSDIIAILSPIGTIRYISPAAEYLWECSAFLMHGQNIVDYLHNDDRVVFNDLLQHFVKQEKANDLHSAVRIIKNNQQWRFFEVTLANLLNDPAIDGIVATFHDVTERNLYERRLTKLAFRDPLTGLANRAHFLERLHNGLLRANSEGHCVAVIFFDLDNFKKVNDTLGHAYGDKVLCAVADKVSSCLRKEDTAARLGGDEFTLLIEGIKTVEQIIPMAKRLLHLLHEPVEIDGHKIFVGGSMGIALSELNKDDHDTLLRKADLAMYQAKSSGKGCLKIYKVDEA